MVIGLVMVGVCLPLIKKYKKRGICVLTEKDINHKKPDEFLIKI